MASCALPDRARSCETVFWVCTDHTMEADTAAAISAVRSIKFAFSGEIRRVGVGSLERDVSGLVTVGSLRKAVRAAFPALKSRNFCLTYRDEDGDGVSEQKW